MSDDPTRAKLPFDEDSFGVAIAADTKPIIVRLEPGTYYWCACGRSQNQPYCDGSHAGTGLGPISFTLTNEAKVSLCTCKRSNQGPFCDGAHKALRNTPTDPAA